ncbi:MAG: hypothetical protein GXY42_02780 [Desulfovibrionales bacterium]|nr:hypothetical protein [Desulfovibrionales bacterium]
MLALTMLWLGINNTITEVNMHEDKQQTTALLTQPAECLTHMAQRRLHRVASST